MRRSKQLAKAAIADGLLIVTFPHSLAAQGVRGGIAGIVRDTTGAVIPGAQVVVTEQDTGAATKTTSRADGAFLIPHLLPGIYRVFGELSGFKRLTIDGLNVDVATTVNQDLTLEVGVVTETVEVSGQTYLVEMSSGGCRHHGSRGARAGNAAGFSSR